MRSPTNHRHNCLWEKYLSESKQLQHKTSCPFWKYLQMGVLPIWQHIFQKWIIRLTGLGFSQRNIMASCGVSQKTVVKVQKRARELNISWPLDESMTDTELQKLMFSKESKVSANKRIPDYAYIRKELLRNGVSKKLLWTEYTVGNFSTWITAALRNEQFFSLAELNRAIREKLEQFNRRLFQKKEGSHRPVQISHISGRNAILSSIRIHQKESWCKGNRYHHWNFLQP